MTGGFRHEAATVADRARILGFPTRICDGPMLTPTTGAPYLIPFGTLLAWLEGHEVALSYLREMVSLIDGLECVAQVPAVMLGGSVLTDPGGARDLDGVVFYQLYGDHHSLMERTARRPGLDLRFVPLDASDGAIMVKLIGYYTLLYSIEKNCLKPVRGPLIVEPPFAFPARSQ